MKLKNNPMKILVKCLFLLAFVNWGYAQKQLMRLNLKLGETYTQHVSTKLVMSQKVGNQDMTLTTQMDISMQSTVKEIKEDIFTLEAQYLRLATLMEMPFGKIAFSSEKEDTRDGVSSLYKAMIGKPFIIKLTNTSKLVAIEGFDELWEQSMQNADGQNPLLKTEFKSQAQQMSQTIENSFMMNAFFPEKAVGLGDEWTIDTQMGAPFPMLIQTKYTLLSRNDKFLDLAALATMSTQGEQSQSMGEMQVKSDLKGKMEISLKVDALTGWILEAKGVQELEGTNEVTGSSALGEGMKMPIKLKGETIVSSQ